MPSAVNSSGATVQCKRVQKIIDFISSESSKERLDKAQEKTFKNVEAACSAMTTVYLELFGEANKKYHCPLEIRDLNNSKILLRCKTCKNSEQVQVLTLTYSTK